MKVALVQMDIRWESPDINREVAERMMLSTEKCDIYVLPEMWNTGVTTEPMGIAEPENGETLQWMQRMADTLDAAVVGSMAVKAQDGTFRNRLYFVKPSTSSDSEVLPQRGNRLLGAERLGSASDGGQGGEGAVQWYDKHHLFSYGGETKNYTPGSEYVTVEWRGLRFHLCVCYDLRFPLWLRNRDNYDVLICVASWPSVRMHAWKVLLAARAIENQCYVLGVNRIGKDPYCEYSGGTCVVDPFGFPTVAPDGEACVLTKDLDLKRLKSFRQKFPVLQEMDL
jgi:predicted amidohydrolase